MFSNTVNSMNSNIMLTDNSKYCPLYGAPMLHQSERPADLQQSSDLGKCHVRPLLVKRWRYSYSYSNACWEDYRHAERIAQRALISHSRRSRTKNPYSHALCAKQIGWYSSAIRIEAPPVRRQLIILQATITLAAAAATPTAAQERPTADLNCHTRIMVIGNIVAVRDKPHPNAPVVRAVRKGEILNSCLKVIGHGEPYFKCGLQHYDWYLVGADTPKSGYIPVTCARKL